MTNYSLISSRQREKLQLSVRHGLEDHLTWIIFSSVVVFVIACLLALLFTLDYGSPISENQLYTDFEGQDGLVLVGHAFHINPPERSLKIGWYPVACGTYFNHSLSISSTNPSNGGAIAECGRPNRNVTIFVDGDFDKPVWEYDPTEIPYSPQSGHQVGMGIPQYSFVMDAQIYLYTFVFLANHHTIGLDFFYPFIRYEITTSVLAISEHDGANSSIPILSASLVTATDNYVPGETRLDQSIVPFEGIDEPVAAHPLRVILKMSTVAVAFSMILFTVNWGLALVVLFMTIAPAVRRFQHGTPIPESVLVMPITIILMIPALRDLFIGDPPFGNVLDVLGFFPQMILVAICSFVLLAIMGREVSGPIQEEDTQERDVGIMNMDTKDNTQVDV